MRLLDDRLRFEVATLPHFRDPRESVEALAFEWRGEPVLLSLYSVDDLRGALRRGPSGVAERGDLGALRELMDGDK
jgi:hypothetical protein